MWRSKIVLLLSFAAGCGGRTRDQGLPEAQERPATTEQNLIYCDGTDSLGFREHYRLAVINRKLGYYPELAAEVGSSSVTNCEEARTFRNIYRSYSELHPGFDRDQPAAPVPDLRSFEPSGPPPTFEGAKLLGGRLPEWAYPHSPVIKLTVHPVNAPPGTQPIDCTGTFIGPSFVLTAAHCLPPVSGDPSDLTGYTKDWQWEITWGDVNGVPLRAPVAIRSRGPDVLQYAHPEYMGTRSDHDLALLYLYPVRYMSILPPVHGGGAMRLSITPPGQAPHATDLTYFAGFASVERPGGNFGFLRYGQALLNDPPDRKPFRLEADIKFPPPPEMEPALPRTFPADRQNPVCRGDSGGPAYRIARALVRRTPGGPDTQEDVPVMVGVTSAYEHNLTGTPPRCSPIGSTAIWERTDEYDDVLDQKLAWIKTTLALWGQSCKTKSLPGQTTEDFVQCWGDPCDDERHCDEDTEFCDDPGTENSQCLAMVEDEHDDMPMPPPP